MSTRKFVADLRYALLSDAGFGRLAAIRVLEEDGLVDDAVRFFIFDDVRMFFSGGDIAKDGVAPFNPGSRKTKPVFVQRVRYVCVGFLLFEFAADGLTCRGV